MEFSLTSPAFKSGEKIPARYTCDLPAQAGGNISPPLSISGVPDGAKSLALIVDDPDVPKALMPSGVFDHWVVFNIQPTITDIREGKVPEGAVVGSNTRGEAKYTGPCPPKEYEPKEHRYFFRLYALSAMLPLKAGASKEEVKSTMQGRILATAELMGTYSRE